MYRSCNLCLRIFVYALAFARLGFIAAEGGYEEMRVRDLKEILARRGIVCEG
jgi:hypothetical protein